MITVIAGVNGAGKSSVIGSHAKRSFLLQAIPSLLCAYAIRLRLLILKAAVKPRRVTDRRVMEEKTSFEDILKIAFVYLVIGTGGIPTNPQS